MCGYRTASMYLLRRHIKGNSPKVNFLVRVYARHDKEDSRTLRTSWSESAKPEDDSSLVLLHNLDTEEEGGRESDHHQQHGQQGQQ